MDKYNRRCAFSRLTEYDAFAGESDFIEVVEWRNGLGFDVNVASKSDERFRLTYESFYLLKKLVKQLQKQ